MRTGSPPAGFRGRAPVRAAASIWFEIWRVVDPGQQNFDFSNKFSRNFIFFRQFLTKIRFSRQIFKRFLFFQAHFWKISIFPGNFLINFDFSMDNFDKFRFPRQIFENFRFFSGNLKKSIFQAKLAIYSCFWAHYSISLQKSPLSNILPVHDKVQ